MMPFSLSRTPLSVSTLPQAPPVETTVPALARLDAWTTSVTSLLREKESFGGRRHKNYSDSFGNFTRLATAQPVRDVPQFAKY